MSQNSEPWKGLGEHTQLPQAPDCMIVEPWGPRPPRHLLFKYGGSLRPQPIGTKRGSRRCSVHGVPKPKRVEEEGADNGAFCFHRIKVKKRILGTERTLNCRRNKQRGHSLSSMHKIFTQLKEKRLLTLGGRASESNKPVCKPKTKKTTKNHRMT